MDLQFLLLVLAMKRNRIRSIFCHEHQFQFPIKLLLNSWNELFFKNGLFHFFFAFKPLITLKENVLEKNYRFYILRRFKLPESAFNSKLLIWSIESLLSGKVIFNFYRLASMAPSWGKSWVLSLIPDNEREVWIQVQLSQSNLGHGWKLGDIALCKVVLPRKGVWHL